VNGASDGPATGDSTTGGAIVGSSSGAAAGSAPNGSLIAVSGITASRSISTGGRSTDDNSSSTDGCTAESRPKRTAS